MRQPAQRPLANHHVANYRAQRKDVSQFSKATPRKTNQPGKKRSRSMILTDTPVINALEAEAAKVKRTTGCTVARTFVPNKELKSAKRHC